METETPVTVEALLGYVRDDIKVFREDNVRQHGEIVHRLDTINGRVHRHDRELSDIQGKMVTKNQLWVGAGTVLTAAGAIIAWFMEHFQLPIATK